MFPILPVLLPRTYIHSRCRPTNVSIHKLFSCCKHFCRSFGALSCSRHCSLRLSSRHLPTAAWAFDPIGIRQKGSQWEEKPPYCLIWFSLSESRFASVGRGRLYLLVSEYWGQRSSFRQMDGNGKA